MKKYYFLLLFLSIAQLTIAQKPIYFSKSFDYGSAEYGAYLEKCKDGFLISSYSWNKDVPITKTDFNGNFLWKKTIDGWNLECMQLINDTLYLAASKYEKNDNDHILFEAMTTDGETIFSRTYSTTDAYNEVSIRFAQTDDKGFLFLSLQGVNLSTGKRLVAFKTDAAGNKLWTHQIENTKKMHEIEVHTYPNLGIQKLDNNQYLINYYGIIANDPKPLILNDTIQKQFFTIMDGKTGKEINTFRTYTDSLRETTFIISRISNNRYFGMVSMWSDTSLLTINAEFATQTVILDSSFHYIQKGSRFLERFSNHLIGSKELEDGSFLGYGENMNVDTTLSAYDHGSWIAKFDSKGFLKWQRIIIDWRQTEAADLGFFYDMETMDNKDIVLVGRFYTWDTDWDISLTRLDSMGCPFPNCKGRLQNITSNYNELLTIQDVQLPNVKVFPNPATTLLLIELYDENYTNQISYEIFDSFGQKIIAETLQNNDSIFKVDVNPLPSGSYLLKIMNKDGAFTVKKFIKL